MAQKKNQNKPSGQLARQSQKSNKSNNGTNRNSALGQPSMAAPVAYSSPTVNNAPKINSSAKSTRIIHRELVGTVSGIATFGSTAYAINPGVAASFPWLSSVAPSYEQYHFRRLRYHYVTRCATSYTGSVLLAPEYDALDAAPSTEVDMAMMAGAKEDVPWRDQVIDFNVLDMFPLGPRKFIRTGALTGTADLKTYDAGQLFVGLSTCADTSAIGKLWVEYDVELHIPQNPNAIQNVGIGACSVYSLGNAQSLTSTAAATIAWDQVYYNGISLSNSSGVFTLPVGKYLVSVAATFSSSNPAGNDMTIVLELLKNGSSISDYCISQYFEYAPSSGGVQTRHLSIIGYVESTVSTDNVRASATMTSSGTLSLVADRSQISVLRIA